MRASFLLAGAALALTSALAMAQGVPESLLPPGFNDPAPAPRAAATPRPAATARPATTPRPSSSTAAAAAPRAVSSDAAVVQVPPTTTLTQSTDGVEAAAAQITAKRLPTLEELARLSPEDFQALLGLKPGFDMPNGARRAMTQVGLMDQAEGGVDGTVLASQNGSLVRLALAANRGEMVSRWGHILLRRALISRLDSPRNMTPQEFLALRVSLLVRMGEADAARAIFQDIDLINYTQDLNDVAIDVYANSADFTGACSVIGTYPGARVDAQWNAAKAICSAFRGDSAAAISQLDRFRTRGTMQRIDLLLAQKYAGAAGRSRRATTIEWDGVKDMTPWRFGLTHAVGLTPPAALMKSASARYDSLAAVAPMVGLTHRAAAADRAAATGVLSSAAMVDLYGQLYAEPDVTGQWSERADKLREAYVQEDPIARVTAMRSLWDGGKGGPQSYSRKVLTAYAAARVPATSALAGSAEPLIISMLAAGLDANAMRWAGVVDAGSMSWALLSLAAPTRSSSVDSGSIEKFVDDDESEGSRKAAFLVAGLAGLGRIESGTASSYSSSLGMGLGSQTRWTQAIEGAARSGDTATVVFLAGLGMQGGNWSQMTPRYLYHIVSALRAVGFEAEARMIAAEAVARA